MDDNMAAPQNDHEILVLLSKEIARMAKLLEGNGKTGLLTRVETIEDQTRDNERAISEVTRLLERHLAETKEERDRRNSWWERVGLEVVKTSLAILSSLTIASLTGLFK